jgi:hypothetical protein
MTTGRCAAHILAQGAKIANRLDRQNPGRQDVVQVMYSGRFGMPAVSTTYA